MTAPWYAIAALCISTIALIVATKNYWRKAGTLVRGKFVLASSRECNDKYVSSITLENLKDRTITIFSIYLRVGHGYYIELENFESKPLLLKAFETFQNEYGPIQLYAVNNNRIDINALLDNPKVKKRIVLSTADGRYVVPVAIRPWSPISDFFKNYMTAIILPIRATYKDRQIGSNIKFAIEFIGENNSTEIALIQEGDHQLKIFRNFQLTQESLQSHEALTVHLTNQMKDGKLKCKEFKVYDVEVWKARATEFYTGERVIAEHHGWFLYHVLGRAYTWNSNRKLRIQNKRNQTLHSKT